MMPCRLVIMMITILAFPASALVLNERRSKVDEDVSVIKAEVRGTLHLKKVRDISFR